MSDVTRILSQIESGDPSAAEQLLPLVYDELRKLAAQKMAEEKPGQTLQATALDLGETGKDPNYGYGLVQAYDAWLYLGGGKPGKK